MSLQIFGPMGSGHSGFSCHCHVLQVQIIDGPLDEALGEVLGHVRRVDLCADVGRVDGGLLAAQLTGNHR